MPGGQSQARLCNDLDLASFGTRLRRSWVPRSNRRIFRTSVAISASRLHPACAKCLRMVSQSASRIAGQSQVRQTEDSCFNRQRDVPSGNAFSLRPATNDGFVGCKNPRSLLQARLRRCVATFAPIIVGCQSDRTPLRRTVAPWLCKPKAMISAARIAASISTAA